MRGVPVIKRLSIITVVLNDADGLRRTAASLVDQKTPDVEWVIVDGGSTDGTAAVIDAFAAHVDARISERDNGVYDAMHKGVALSSGQHLCFLNAGDELLPAALLAAGKVLTNAPRDAVICGAWISVDGGDDEPQVIQANLAELVRWMSVSHQASFLPRSAFVEGRGYDLSYKLSADYDLFLRLYLSGTLFLRIEEPLVKYYRGGLSDQNYIRSRLETIRSLWRNKSPEKLSGTLFYIDNIFENYAHWRVRTLKRKLFGQKLKPDPNPR